MSSARGSCLSIEVNHARHDAIEKYGVHRKEIDQGPDGMRRWILAQNEVCANEDRPLQPLTRTKTYSYQCQDGTVSTYAYTHPILKRALFLRLWYLEGHQSNSWVTPRSRTPRSRSADLKEKFVADINAALEGKHAAKLALSNGLGRHQCQLVKQGFEPELFAQIKEDVEKNHHNPLYVTEKRRLKKEGKFCDCEECLRFPLGHPSRDILLTDIDHDGPMGPILKEFYGNLQPTEIRDQTVIDAQHDVFAPRCPGGHHLKDCSTKMLISAGEFPNLNAAGTGTAYSPSEISKYQALTDITLERIDGQCPSSGMPIHDKNVVILHKHHVTGQLAGLVTRGAGQTALVVDMGKHVAVSQLVRARNSDYAELVARELSVTFPLIGKHHRYFHLLEKRPVICEQNGAVFPWKDSNGCRVISLKNVPELEAVLGNLSDDEIVGKFDGVEIAKWDEDGKLLNAPTPPPAEEEEEESSAVDSDADVALEEPASSLTSPSHLADILKCLQRSMGDDELSDEQRREAMTDSLRLLGEPSLRLAPSFARFLFGQLRVSNSLTNILARLSRHDDASVAIQASAAIVNLISSANRSRESQISQSLVDVVAKELVPQTSRERREAELLDLDAARTDAARQIAQHKEAIADSNRRMAALKVQPVTLDLSKRLCPFEADRPLKKGRWGRPAEIRAGPTHSFSANIIPAQTGFDATLRLLPHEQTTSSKNLNGTINDPCTTSVGTVTICPLIGHESGCEHFFGYYDHKKIVPRIKVASRTWMFLVSPKLRRDCQHLSHLKKDGTVYGVIVCQK